MSKTYFNYSDPTPKALRDVVLANSIDQEQFNLFGVATSYYKLDLQQDNFDPVFRDTLSSKTFLQPKQVRSFFKVDESTTHGMTDTGAVQTAERTGTVWFNISLIEHELGRVPIIGDVVENLQLAQKFELFQISKEMHKLGRPFRYACKVRLYQDTL